MAVPRRSKRSNHQYKSLATWERWHARLSSRQSEVISGGMGNHNLTLSSANRTALMTTQHNMQIPQWGSNESYGLDFYAGAGVKMPVGVTLTQDPNVIGPFGVGQCSDCGNRRLRAARFKDVMQHHRQWAQPSIGNSPQKAKGRHSSFFPDVLVSVAGSPLQPGFVPSGTLRARRKSTWESDIVS